MRSITFCSHIPVKKEYHCSITPQNQVILSGFPFTNTRHPSDELRADPITVQAHVVPLKSSLNTFQTMLQRCSHGMTHRSLSLQVEEAALQEKWKSGLCYISEASLRQNDDASKVTLEGRLNERGLPLRISSATFVPNSTYTFTVTLYIREDVSGEAYYKYLGDMHSAEFRISPTPTTPPTAPLAAEHDPATSGFTSNILRACAQSAPSTTSAARQAPTTHHVSANRLSGQATSPVPNNSTSRDPKNTPYVPPVPIASSSISQRVLDYDLMSTLSHKSTAQHSTAENNLLQPIQFDERLQQEYIETLRSSRASPVVLDDLRFLPVSDLCSSIDTNFMTRGGVKTKSKNGRKKPPLASSTPRSVHVSSTNEYSSASLKPNRSCGDLTSPDTLSMSLDRDWVRHSFSLGDSNDATSSTSSSPRASVESPQFFDRAYSLFYSKYGYLLNEDAESIAKFKRNFDNFLIFSRGYCSQKVSQNASIPGGVATLNSSLSRDSADEGYMNDMPPPAKRQNSSRDPSPVTTSGDYGIATDNMMYDFDDLALFQEAMLSPPTLTPRSDNDLFDRISPSLYALLGDAEDLSNDTAITEDNA